MEAEIVFADKKLKEQYESLDENPEFGWLYKALNRAFADISKDPSIGVPIKKYRIPADLRLEKINNLWKYDMPSGWRLLYSLGRHGITIMALVLEWCDHDSYQKRYGGRR